MSDKTHLPNAISLLRIAGSIGLLFCNVSGWPFWTLYELYDNYVELFAYLEKGGYKIADAPRAVYIDGIWNQEDPAK